MEYIQLMKVYFTVFLFLLVNIGFGQVTNVKSGAWSDQTVWSNGILPTDTTRIILNFDIHVDINASCKSLNTNGHNIIVDLGKTFNSSGVAAPVAGFTYTGPFAV